MFSFLSFSSVLSVESFVGDHIQYNAEHDVLPSSFSRK